MYGIIAEDNSDIECLKVLIKRLADNHTLTIKGKGYKGCANLLRDGWNQLKVYEKSGINRFIICYDKDKATKQSRYEEIISKILKPSDIKKDKNKICILIPTEEIETWILADIKAVTQIISSWQPSENFSSPEMVENPKEKLIKLSQIKNSKPLYDYTTHNPKIFEKINLQTVKNKYPSFAELYEFVKNDTANYPKL